MIRNSECKQISLLFYFVVVLLFLPALVFSQPVDLDVQGHISIAPTSIPIGSAGATGIGIARLQFRPTDDTLGTSMTIDEIQIQATTSGTFNANWVSSIEVYFEPKGEATGYFGEYDNGAGRTDVRADLAANRPYTFTGNTATIDIDPTVVAFTRPGGASNYLFVIFNLTSNADTAETLGCEITSVSYTHPNQTLFTASPTAHGGTGNLDDLTVTAAAAGIAPLEAAANDTNVEVFRLDLSLADTSATAYLDEVKVHRPAGVGADDWVTNNGVLLYEDDGDDAFEPGADDGVAVATGNLGGGYATLTVSPSIDVPASGKSFFVAVNMNSLNAIPNQTFGLEVENPSTDITFIDEIEDDSTNDDDPDYAYVTYSADGLYEYDQTAYVDPTSTSIIPSSGNTFSVKPADDGAPPTVVTTVPEPGAPGVDRNANLTIIFSEWMTASTVTNSANFELTDGVTPVTVGLSYNEPTQTLTVNPSTTLNWGTLYTATVKAAVEDYYNNQMGTDYSWTFTVEPETLPYISSRSPATGAIDIAVNTTVQVTFSEDMDTTSYAANFELRDSGDNPVVGEITASGLRNLIFTPGSVASPVDLNNNETYTVWVRAGVTDLEGSTKGSDESWTFTTIRLYPEFEEPIVIKNRIGTGANSEALIFVPEPPGGPSERVSVQVFTTTGRLVRTFYRNVPWTTIGEDPILWDGTNDQGKNLGPGMYFIQIRTDSYKRVLKVMIVR